MKIIKFLEKFFNKNILPTQEPKKVAEPKDTEIAEPRSARILKEDKTPSKNKVKSVTEEAPQVPKKNKNGNKRRYYKKTVKEN